MKTILKILLVIIVIKITIIYFTNKNNPLNTKNNYNIMVLGLDPRNDALEKTETTDTIILASLNFKTNKLNMISLPRDLWSYPLNNKINQIYPQNINNFEKIQSSFTDILGQNIDKTVVITSQNLIDLVAVLDGVDVNLDKGFKDEKYPNPEYIKNPIPSIPTYITVEFASGPIHLDQTNISPFVRSRHSTDDLDRIKRQQLVIEAIFHKMFNPKYITKLNDFYKKEIKTNLGYDDLVNISLKLKQNILKISLNKIELPIGTNAKNGVIYYPNKLTNKQWAFIPSDKDYKSFKDFINKSIK